MIIQTHDTMSTEPEPTASADQEEEAPPPHLGNIAFWASDFPAMRKFYTEILGIPELSGGEYKGKGWAFYGYGPFSFSLNQAEFTPVDNGWSLCPMPGSSGDNWSPYITFYVPDLTEVLRRCKEAGIVVKSEEPFSLGEGFGHSIEVRDPDGNAIAITQR